MAPRKIVLPQTIGKWRKTHQDAIAKAESEKGHALRLVELVRNRIQRFYRFQDQRTLTPNQVQVLTKGILLVVSELTDELQTAAKGKQNVRTLTWKTRFSRCLQAFWPEFPKVIQNEIRRQSRTSFRNKNRKKR